MVAVPRFEVFGLKEAQGLQLRILGRVMDLRDVFRGPVDREVTTFFRRQFASSGAYGGTKWRQLTQATLRDKARVRRAGMGILRRSNRLWASLVKSGGPEGIRVVQPLKYERGTAVPHARYHQTGATLNQWGGVRFKRSKQLPRRPLVPDQLPSRVTNRWLRHVQQHIEKAAHGR